MGRKASAALKVRGVFQRKEDPGVWWIRYHAHGQMKRERVGLSKQEAIDKYRQRKTEIKAGKQLPRNLKDAKITFQTLIDDVLVYSERHHKDTRNVTSRCAIIGKEFGTWAVEDIRSKHIESWLHERRTPTGAKPSGATFNIYRSLFSLIFRQAIRDGKATENPAKGIRKKPLRNTREKQLSPDEFTRIKEIVQRRWPDRWHEFVISLGTGMRLSEQYNLTWRSVDFTRGVVDLRNTKNGEPREIPMGPEVEAAFTAMKGLCFDTGPDGRVFISLRPGKWFKEALKDANIEDYVWHSNRHTFCSRLAKNNAHMKTIQKLAGHKTITMSARYIKTDDETLRNAVTGLF
ncbi:tyrosine-type recombinase/integrase [Terriglobus roseus]|uniref:Site-specific recombinase XerD n=1 Tax=Terriglobus roseus TaxID=392734 RepID=A0A1H4J2S2_9BACT|nr:site-specific integrase [Terriglobus roseus]SEB40355.1 Site-specific recombinase XerD [Terriglobus roseus]